MGDTGSLALGATLGVVALMTGRWIILPLIAVIPISEALSVIIQVAYFKATKGKRFFKMAPLHHILSYPGGVNPGRTAIWLVSLVFAMLGIALTMVE